MKHILGQSPSYRMSDWKFRLPIVFLAVLLVGLLWAVPAAAADMAIIADLDDGQVDVYYSETLEVVGGTGPYTWSDVSLPSWLTLTAGSGDTAVLSGTPTEAGNYTFVITVEDSTTLSETETYTITITEEPITFTTTSLDEATEGVSYADRIYVDGGTSPYTYSLVSGTLPSGLSLDTEDGIIEGTPASGTTGTYYFTIQVTDSSSPALTATYYYSLVVEAGYFNAEIRISSSLTSGEADIYADDVLIGSLEGGESLTWSFDVDEEPVISVDETVYSSTNADVRFVADDDEIEIDVDDPDVTFTYTAEYYVDIKTDPSQITTISGSDWYEEGSFIEATAPALIEESEDTEYRFAYWLLPDGDQDVNEDLEWKVISAGKATATYDAYYLLTVTSANGDVEGGGWYEEGTVADWSVEPAKVSMSGLMGLLGGKLEATSDSDEVVMTSPRTVTVSWESNYTMPAVWISLFVVALIVAAIIIWRRTHPPQPKTAPAAAAPAPPTIVLLDGKLGQGGTREQLVDQFKHLLEKYQDEVGGGAEGGGGRGIPEAQLLAAGKEEPCGNTSKRLLRTVVGRWHKVEEEVIPPDEEKGIETTTIRTVWGREIYKEWEVSVCSLPRGHSGNHHGNVFKSYTLQDSVSEELSYAPKQKTMPPKSHYTDELPVVDVSPNQVMPSEGDIADDEGAIDPDEVISPDEESED